jgi:hypothetical protein
VCTVCTRARTTPCMCCGDTSSAVKSLRVAAAATRVLQARLHTRSSSESRLQSSALLRTSHKRMATLRGSCVMFNYVTGANCKTAKSAAAAVNILLAVVQRIERCHHGSAGQPDMDYVKIAVCERKRQYRGGPGLSCRQRPASPPLCSSHAWCP